jgi:pilus assembly protein Flp/PilA
MWQYCAEWMRRVAKGKNAMFDGLRVVVFDEGGATAVEYGLIAALVSIAGVAALTTMGSSLTGIFNYISDLTASASS